MNTIQYRSLAKTNIIDFINDLANSNLVQQPPTDLQLLVNSYETELSHLRESHARLQSKTITKHTGSKWFISELERALECKYKPSGLTIVIQLHKDETLEYEMACRCTK